MVAGSSCFAIFHVENINERQQAQHVTGAGTRKRRGARNRAHREEAREYANVHFGTDSANEYTNATASLPSLCGQEEHSRHIISECFSSQCDNMSAPVPVTTPHHIDIHQLCGGDSSSSSSRGWRRSHTRNMTQGDKIFCIHLQVYQNAWRQHATSCVHLVADSR